MLIYAMIPPVFKGNYSPVLCFSSSSVSEGEYFFRWQKYSRYPCYFLACFSQRQYSLLSSSAGSCPGIDGNIPLSLLSIPHFSFPISLFYILFIYPLLYLLFLKAPFIPDFFLIFPSSILILLLSSFLFYLLFFLLVFLHSFPYFF